MLCESQIANVEKYNCKTYNLTSVFLFPTQKLGIENTWISGFISGLV
jgi:hypothetical protein